MKKTLSILMLVVLACSATSYAQETKQIEADISTSKVVLLGKTRPIRDIKKAAEHRSTKAKFKQDKQKPANFPNRGEHTKVVIPELEHLGPDPIRQTWAKSIANAIDVEPTINMDGVSSSFGAPNDPTGDVGIDYYVQAINATDVGVYNKSDGSMELEFEMQSLWSEFGASSAGDPIILFDDTENRWFLTEFTGPANLLIAVSETSDPLGSYFAYNFSTPNFPDYPKYGIWPEALVVTTNEQGGGTLHQYFINKASLINGEATAEMQRISVGGNNTEGGFLVTTPVDIDGGLDPSDIRPVTMVLEDSSWGAAPEDRINIYRFDIDWANANNTVVEEFSIVTTPFDSYPCSAAGFGFACVPQLGGNGLDAIPEVIMNVPKLRRFPTHESLVLSFITDATSGDNLSAIRWVELRKDIGLGEWSLYQEGTYAPDDGLDRFMSSIAMDANGNMGLGYNVSSADSYVGVRFTGRIASDPLGEMTVTEYEAVAGQSTINSGGRFGDYSQMGIDPVNGSTFWFTTEYAAANGVRTRIVAFEIQPNNFDLAAIQVQEPTTSSELTATETVTFEVSNVGLTAMTNYTIGYSLDGIFIEDILITDELAPGASYSHMFTTPLNMSALGPYTIVASISHPDDEGAFNDETTSIVEHLLARDAQLANLQIPENTCVPSASATVTITNLGFDAITSAQIEVTVNGVVQNTFDWTGNIPYNDTADYTFDIDIVDGNNTLDVVILNVNGDTDENLDNNAVDGSIELITGVEFVFTILTDNFPQETTWEIVNDDTNAVVADGGPYDNQANETFVRSICVPEDQCYTFTINDTYGDGICCAFGEGFYLLEQNGTIVFEGGQFQQSAEHSFCGQPDNVKEQGLLGEDDYTLVLSPNPSDGYFQVALTTDNFQSDNVLMEIYDMNGKAIQHRSIGKYDGVYVTTVSLVAYASGTYILKLSDKGQSITTQVIKR